MLNSLKFRWLVVVAAVLLGAIWISPNFVKYDKDSLLGKSRIVLGLDIQGGLHLVMGVDVQTVIQERAIRQAKDLGEQFKADGMSTGGVSVAGENKTEIEIIKAGGAESEAAILKVLQDRYGSTFQIVQNAPDKIRLRYFDAVMIDMKKQVVSQAIEVIRNRIDEFGVSEPNVAAQSDDRILVQLPGVKDALRAKELINKTAKLDFRVVSNEIPSDKLETMISDAEKAGKYKLGQDGMVYSVYVKKVNEDLAKSLPANTKIVFEKIESATNLESGKTAYLVYTDSALGGSQVEDAAVRPDEMGKPEVTFSFSVEGRKLFAELTQRAAGGLIAIVLDDVVKSAPRVERQIDSDSARITLGGVRDFQAAQNEASLIAMALRAGSLPAALEQLEERTVGPSLGSDSINKAKNATLIGALAVILFMIFYYRTAGLIADVALMLNIFLTFAILTTLGATLTLPGVAGIALTVGMAVDANIIIFERIKEELRKGSTQLSALKDGFDNAFSAVFDSNLTTILTCVVLMYYGTGPIRGFAVTLMIGITCSMFTAIFVSRVLLDTLMIKMKLNVFSAKKA
jgi:preprotein translocase subunit SecD